MLETTLDWKRIAELNQDPALQSAGNAMRWAAESGLKLALASSFSAEDTTLIHLLAQEVQRDSSAAERIHVFYLETGRLHEETLQTLEECRKRYPALRFEGYFPQRESVENLIREQGLFSFYDSIENRKNCCFIRKVEPLKRALEGLDGWITGLRQSQAVTRANLPVFQIDSDHGGILKLSPLSSWQEADVYKYIEENGVPVNPLHSRGYPSIGCAPCTRAVEAGEDVRAGRWWWENPEHKECGLHASGDKS
ncbi:MAG: phosphoadenylyl-sulfate reductase [Spirochaetaceae bacterium]|nr:phosphoadenylyl-sulfate reductase [Spirochaetaceae bacterium]|tara:strand:+ start:47833 stop:48588 length:756 start_codon:yes stop_codon:yes gene_type:complete